MRYRSSFVVRADPQTSFDYLADGRNGMWSHPRGTTVELIPPAPAGLGSRFIFHRPSGPDFQSAISLFEPPSRLGFTGGFEGQSPTEATWELVPVPAGTRLSVETVPSFIGPRWLQPVVGLMTLVAWPLLLFKMARFERRIKREIEARG